MKYSLQDLEQLFEEFEGQRCDYLREFVRLQEGWDFLEWLKEKDNPEFWEPASNKIPQPKVL